MLDLFSRIKASTSALFFPNFCLECEDPLEPKEKLLCAPCSNKLELVDPENRCRRCFGQAPCPKCPQVIKQASGLASCFEYYGPIKNILHAFKYGDKPELALPLASFLLLQLERLSWPTPELITYAPQHFLRTKMRGYNQSELLANKLSTLLGAACTGLLQKNSAHISQALLSKKLRIEAPQEAISLCKPNLVEDKVVLLIDDVYTTGRTLQICTEALSRGYPKKIYILTLCYTDNDN
jgi:ComF family protein